MLSDLIGVPAISVGQLLRDEVEASSEEGKTAKGYMERGEWVPHETTFKVLKKRLEQDDVKDGFILDAFPRLWEEYHQLMDYFKERNWKLDAVINLNVSDVEVLRRIKARSEVQATKGVYRPDTREEVTLQRLKVHHETAQPILDKFKEDGLLINIDGDKPIGMVHLEIIKALGLYEQYKDQI